VLESHAGRLLDYFHLHVRDVDASKSFYSTALEPMGLEVTFEGDGWFSIDELRERRRRADRGAVGLKKYLDDRPA
jgi:hypothetical protein